MEEKLITIAIHSFEKAQILKTVLEKEHIKVYIHNVNLVAPKISAGVRVRIKEIDLPKALQIIEDSNLVDEKGKLIREEKNKVLIPIDFSNYSLRACEFGFRLAKTMDAEIMLLHAYFSPIYGSLTFSEVSFEINESDTIKKALQKVNNDIEKFKSDIEAKIKSGELPLVNFNHTISEGIPEEEIIRFSKEYKPSVIVMGTRGKNQKDIDLIGSVTAEVIERSAIPVFTIPEDTPFADFSKVKNIAYATNFGQKDLIGFEKMIQFLQPFNFKIYFTHIQQKEDIWNEIKLAGIKEYFKSHYPNLETEYCLIKDKDDKDDDILNALDKFVIENKIDIISLNTHKRNIFARLFNPSLSHKMLFHSDTPMLIFHV
jgi:nucleotide-binding universal stress UspA family protein